MTRKSFMWIALAAALLCSCAKPAGNTDNADIKRHIEAWLKANYPDATPTPLGAYLLGTEGGSGAPVGDADKYPYVRIHFTVSDMTGTINTTTKESIAKQIGDYDETGSYEPVILQRSQDKQPAGLDEAFSLMKIGEVRKTVLPGWLMGKERYSSAEEYMKKGSGNTVVYEIEMVEAIPDIKAWEIDSIGRYLAGNHAGMTAKDSLSYGFYYVRTKEPSTTEAFKKDTSVFINYTGRLLNGKVFDTTVADTAKFYGIYSSSKDYKPIEIQLDEEVSKYEFKASGSSMISGFATTISKMHYGESGSGIFYSTLGYGASKQSNAILPYTPLRFDIEIVK